MSWTRTRSRGHPAVWLPVVLVVGAMAGLGAGAQTWVSARARAISDAAATDRELAVAQALELIRLCETALLASSVLFAALLYAFFRRGLRERRLPPSGWWSLGAWRVASGPDVRRMGRLGLALAARCLTVACTAACTAELPAATPEGLRAAREAVAAFPKARCDACHGAGEAPGWATEPESITRVRLERHSGGGYRVPSATKTLAFEQSLSARRLVELSGEAPTDGLGAFGARAPADERAALAPDQWAALAAAVANSGLFRFEGEAVSTIGTHGETAFVFVERRDRGTCILGSMWWPDDDAHETFAQVLRAIEEVEAGLAWSSEER